MAGIDFKEIVTRMSALEFAQRELRMDRAGKRAQCPFHGGEHFNLAFMRDGKCYCHVCHRVGDVIELASAVWGCNKLEAAIELNRAYALGVSIDDERSAVEARETAERRRKERETEREREALERAARVADFDRALQIEREGEAALLRFGVGDADNPALWETVARVARAQERINCHLAGVD